MVADRLLNKLVECGGFMHKDTSIYESPETHSMSTETFESLTHIAPYFMQELNLITKMHNDEYYCLTPLGHYAQKVGFAVFFDQLVNASAIDFINKQESILTAKTTRKHLKASYIFSSIALVISILGTVLSLLQ